MSVIKHFRPCMLLLGAALILGFTAGCKSKDQDKAAQGEIASIDRVGSSPLGTSQVVLHKDFVVRASSVFSFEIPAHAAMPHLRGSYKSFVTKLGVQTNEDAANVDFFVLTEEQYADFVQGGAGTGDMLFSVDDSHQQNVDVVLPPSLNQTRKFYLVFRNTPGGDANKAIRANLRVDF
ncbi:MAG: hypothetical protein ACLQLC_00820 [Candidatus Sulfotelmatobacter sp.]